jgi:hypothetical protein
MTDTLSLSDRWNRFRYLQTVELWLDAMPGRRRRAVLKELRANLEAAVAEIGMSAALADLGRPRALACHYLDEEPAHRPHWNQGALAAGLVVGAWLYATLFYTMGMLHALRSTGAANATGSLLGTDVSAVATAEVVSAGFAGFPWSALVAALLAFLLVGRAWNALPGRRRAPARSRHRGCPA